MWGRATGGGGEGWRRGKGERGGVKEGVRVEERLTEYRSTEQGEEDVHWRGVRSGERESFSPERVDGVVRKFLGRKRGFTEEKERLHLYFSKGLTRKEEKLGKRRGGAGGSETLQ